MTCGSGLAALVLLAVLGVAVEMRRPIRAPSSPIQGRAHLAEELET